MSQRVVIIGQGYVGLPLAEAATLAGHAVTGLEINESVVSSLNGGRSHVDDLSNVELRTMLDAGYRATLDPAHIRQADVVMICVPTPLAPDRTPDLTAVELAASTIADHLAPGALVILESTTYPGTTEDVVLPILRRNGREHNQHFSLAFSAERVDPGNPTYGIRNTPKVVGGVTPRDTDRAAAFYSTFIDTVVTLSGTREAETAKLLENTYRHVNIALVNEMARFCHDLGIDIWEVIRGASSKPFGFQPFTPGPGVGGHCIPIDPNYLGYQVRKTLGYQFRFVELAQEINDSMPAYVVQRLMDLLNERDRALKGARILLLGVTYKPNVADQRESPAVPLARLLTKKGALIQYADPYVPSWTVDGIEMTSQPDVIHAAQISDAVLLVQAHAEFDVEDIGTVSRLLFDTRGVSRGRHIVRL